VAYSFTRDGKTPIFVVPLTGGTPELVCADCGEVEQWAPGGGEILFMTGRDPSSIGLIRLPSSTVHEWLAHPDYGVFNARLSSDGRWVAFNTRRDKLAPARVVVARVSDHSVAADKDWMTVAVDGDAPAWSPDASLLYFWSNRDGSPCLWAQPLDRERRERPDRRSGSSTSTAEDYRGATSIWVRRASRWRATGSCSISASTAATSG
jgi:Tol biopolymer transport system component